MSTAGSTQAAAEDAAINADATDRAEADAEAPARDDDGGGGGCYRYFGVRSHLHQLYDYGETGAPRSCADKASRGSLFPTAAGGGAYCKGWARRGSRPCAALLWLALMWLGVFSLFAGLALMLAGYTVPRQAAVIGYASLSAVAQQGPASAAADGAVSPSPVEEATNAAFPPADLSTVEPARELLLVDRSALDLNAALDACKVAGLVTLCSGGLVLILALAAPFARPFSASGGCARGRVVGGLGEAASACCDSQRNSDDRQARDYLLGQPVTVGQTDKVIPAAHFVTGVQPRLKPD